MSVQRLGCPTNFISVSLPMLYLILTKNQITTFGFPINLNFGSISYFIILVGQ